MYSWTKCYVVAYNLIITWYSNVNFYGISAQNSCLQTNSENGLPFFRGYDEAGTGAPDRRIHHKHQAIIPSYKFNCCGNITEWGVDLNPDTESGTFNFIFQVWRPSPTVNITGCYSLVNDFFSSSISITSREPVARVVPPLHNQLQFLPGDVLGFYVEHHVGQSSYNNGVVQLGIDSSHTRLSEFVWHACIDITAAQTSQSGSCPYPIGTSGVLNSLTHAAPVISVSLTTAPCSNTPLPATITSFLSKYPTSTNLASTVTITSRSHTPVKTLVASPSFSISTNLVPTELSVMTSLHSHTVIVTTFSTFLSYPTSTNLTPTESYTTRMYSEGPSKFIAHNSSGGDISNSIHGSHLMPLMHYQILHYLHIVSLQ